MKGEFTDTNEECGCEKRDESALEEVMLTNNFTFKELLEIFCNTECVTDK